MSTFIFPPTSGGGGGAVASVNGFTGAVVLTADDVGAASKALDNLASTAVNADINPDTDNAYVLGTPSLRWQSVATSAIDAGTGGLILTASANVSVDAGTFVMNAAPTILGDNTNARPLAFTDKDNSFAVYIKAPDTLTQNTIYTLPLVDGGSGDVLSSDGAGNMTWTPAAASTGTTVTKSATTVDLDLSNPGTASFDSYGAVAGDKILVIAQSDLSQNGVYVFDSSATPMVRDTAWDSASEFTQGKEVIVMNGNTYPNTTWMLQVAVTTLGTDAVVFTLGGFNPSFTAGDIVPVTTNTYDVGSASKLFKVGFFFRLQDSSSVNVIDLFNRRLQNGAGTVVLDFNTNLEVNASIVPTTDNTINLGSAANRFIGVYAQTLNDSSGNDVLNLDNRTLQNNTGADAFNWATPGTLQVLANVMPNTNETKDFGNDSLRFNMFYGRELRNRDAQPYISLNSYRIKDGSDATVLDYSGRQLRSAADVVNFNFSGETVQLYNSTSDPGSPTAGMIYFNTTLNKLKMYNGTTWETITSI